MGSKFEINPELKVQLDILDGDLSIFIDSLRQSCLTFKETFTEKFFAILKKEQEVAKQEIARLRKNHLGKMAKKDQNELEALKA